MMNNQFDAALLCDAYARVFGAHSCAKRIIRNFVPISAKRCVIGRAVTLRLRRVPPAQAAGREAVLAAYDAVPAGAVLMVQVVGDAGGAVLGDVIGHRLKRTDVSAVVVDGAVRDVRGISDLGLPVWSRAQDIAGMVTAELALESGCSLTVGGVTVAPDDLVAADDGGIFVVPEPEVAATLEAAQKVLAHDVRVRNKLAGGASLRRALMGTD